MCKVLEVKKRNCYNENQTMVRKKHKLFNKFLFFNTGSTKNRNRCSCSRCAKQLSQRYHKVCNKCCLLLCIITIPSLLLVFFAFREAYHVLCERSRLPTQEDFKMYKQLLLKYWDSRACYLVTFLLPLTRTISLLLGMCKNWYKLGLQIYPYRIA